MTTLKIKPLSVNKAWKGRRYKTKDYNNFEKEMLFSLPNGLDVPKGKLLIILIFGFSNKGADIDNPTKLVLDILSKKYKFNDNRVYSILLEKQIVKKGGEFISFKIISNAETHENLFKLL